MFKYSVEILQKLVNQVIHSTTANNILKAVIGSWLFFAGIHTYIYCVLALVVIDVVTGIIASIKKGEEFRSRILRKGLVEKVILYNLLMISVFVLEIVIKTAFNYSTFYLVLIATVCITTYELSSIMENILVIKPELGFVRKLINLINKLQDKTVDIAAKKIDLLDGGSGNE